MKRMLSIYGVLLLIAAVIALFDRQWGGFTLLLTMMVWFVHAVFATTGDQPRL